jgi:hypothetical protein
MRGKGSVQKGLRKSNKYEEEVHKNPAQNLRPTPADFCMTSNSSHLITLEFLFFHVFKILTLKQNIYSLGYLGYHQMGYYCHLGLIPSPFAGILDLIIFKISVLSIT